MRIYVTGATGFVGGNLVRHLLDQGYQVRALARKGSDRRNVAGLPLDLVEGGLNDRDILEKSLQGCDWLFHTAAHYSLARRDATAMYRSNVDGSRTIFAAAGKAGVKRIVYTSSVAAVGVPPDGTIGDETLTTEVGKLVSAYKKSKFLAEEEARRAARAGLPLVIVNPSTPIGPYDVKPTPTGDIILRFLRREMPMYVHTGLNLVHVDDVCRGHVLAAERGKFGERYILGNRNVTLKEMLDMLATITGLAAPTRAIPHWIPIAVGYVDEYVVSRLRGKSPTVPVDSARMARHAMFYSSEKAVRELGLPQTPVETALRDAVAWFQENGYVR